ncbi:integrase core domain-containing protein [Ornithinimicrobium flavum]|uniref:integrase core domain-containing protein n=1 Tax=Ornithinimicrobium flavum TaxID=1288636 RepID=UPI00106FC7BC|nr:integrase core domain-containing protein [Ornithinimicrobium flavum]
MPTTRFCKLIGVPERTYRRWQAHARAGRPRGALARPARQASWEVVTGLAAKHAAWGHRKVWAMARHSGHRVSMSTTARILDDAGLLLKADYQRERRQLAQQRKAAFARSPTGPNMVWQFDFSPVRDRRWRDLAVAGIADYWSKYEFGWHWSPTANQHDAIAAVQLALAEAESMLPAGLDLLEYLADPDTGEVVPITLVTDNGGPFRSARFAAFIEATPQLDHVRTRVRTPGQNGVRERAFQSLKYERLYREQIDDMHDLVAHGEDFRVEFNAVRPHEALSWNRPREVHLRLSDPGTPNFPEPENLPRT